MKSKSIVNRENFVGKIWYCSDERKVYYPYEQFKENGLTKVKFMTICGDEKDNNAELIPFIEKDVKPIAILLRKKYEALDWDDDKFLEQYYNMDIAFALRTWIFRQMNSILNVFGNT